MDQLSNKLVDSSRAHCTIDMGSPNLGGAKRQLVGREPLNKRVLLCCVDHVEDRQEKGKDHCTHHDA